MKKDKLPVGVTRLPVEYKPHKKSRKPLPVDYEFPDNVEIFPFDKLPRGKQIIWGPFWRYPRNIANHAN